MDDKMQQKAQEVIKQIQENPDLLAQFKKNPSKTIEQIAGVNIPAILEPQINKMAQEALDGKTDPMELISKFIK